MERPARVRIRKRKPCVLARRLLLGWNVRLLTGNSSRFVGGRATSVGSEPDCLTVRCPDAEGQTRRRASDARRFDPLWTAS